MSNFTTAGSKRLTPDPNKRVNYPLGLVLGVDEFEQEQAYFLERDRQHNRSLHGCGTVCGLQVTCDDKTVIVSPGLAIDPKGRVIQVSETQCGSVEEWLSVPANRDAMGAQGPAQLYVVLGYRECKTNKVPIPGAPCRSEEENLDYSRVSESFKLMFSPIPPKASEEAAVRAFGDLLARLQIAGNGAGPFISTEEICDAVRDLLSLNSISSPISSPLWIKPEDAEIILSAALRIWVTEVRPQLNGAQESSNGQEECVLLARLDFTIDLDWKVSPAPLPGDPDIVVDSNERPLLLHTRLLQEWLQRYGQEINLTGGGDLSGQLGNATVIGLQTEPVSPAAPGAGQVLMYNAGQWKPSNLPDLTGEVEGSLTANRVVKVQGHNISPTVPPDPAAGQVLTLVSDGGELEWQAADPPSRGEITLAGDVTGGPGTTVVEGLRGRTVSATAPRNGQVLRYSGNQWRPFTPPSNFVEYPSNLPPYHIMAAGVLSAATARIPLYDSSLALHVLAGNEHGYLLITFDTYEEPSGSHFYIVKAVPVLDKGARQNLGLNAPVVVVDSFTNEGILLWITDTGDPVNTDMLREMELMLEISFYKV